MRIDRLIGEDVLSENELKILLPYLSFKALSEEYQFLDKYDSIENILRNTLNGNNIISNLDFNNPEELEKIRSILVASLIIKKYYDRFNNSFISFTLRELNVYRSVSTTTRMLKFKNGLGKNEPTLSDFENISDEIGFLLKRPLSILLGMLGLIFMPNLN
jgi:hypothetical protein